MLLQLNPFLCRALQELVAESIDQPTSANETAKSDRLTVEESILSEEQDAKSVESGDDISTGDNPTLSLADESSELTTPVNVDTSSMDAMSNMSDVSNVAVVPSECCSFLDEPIEEDFGPEVVEQEESVSQLEDSEMLNGSEHVVEDDQVPNVSTTTPLVNGHGTTTPAILSTTQPSGDVEDGEEGITLSPEDMSEERIERSINQSAVAVEPVEEVQGKEPTSVVLKTPTSPQADYTDVRGVKQLMRTPKPLPQTPKADYTNVEGVKQLLQTPNVAKTAPESPQADYTDVTGVKKLMETPKPPSKTHDFDPTDEKSPVHQLTSPKAVVAVLTSPTTILEVEKEEELPKISAQTVATPKSNHTNGNDNNKSPVLRSPEKSPLLASSVQKSAAAVDNQPETPKPSTRSTKGDYSYVEGVKKLLQTPQPVVESPKADYTNVEGMKQLLQTPKTKVAVVMSSPQADYSDVRGVKKLLETPKPPPSTPKADYTDVRGVKRLLKTPKAAPSTPKADYTNVEGIDQLMKTPKPTDADPQNGDETIDKDIVIQEEIADESKPARRPSLSPDSGCQTPTQDVNLDGLDEKEVSDEPAVEVHPSTGEDPVVEEMEEAPPTGEEAPEMPTVQLTVDVEPTKPVETPRRGRRAAVATPKIATPKPRSKKEQSPPPSEKDAVEPVQKDSEGSVKSVTDEAPTKVGEATNQQQEKIVEGTPRRGRKATVATPKTPKLGSKKVSTPPPSESGPETVEEKTVDAVEEESAAAPVDSKSPPKSESTKAAEETDIEVSSTSQRGRRATAATPKVNTPKPRSKKVQTSAPTDSESESVKEDGVPVVKETDENGSDSGPQSSSEMEEPLKAIKEIVTEVPSTPQRGRRATAATPKVNTPKPRSKKAQLLGPTDNESESIEEKPVDTVEDGNPAALIDSKSPLKENEPAKEPVVEVSSTSQRGRRATAATPKVNTPKPRSRKAQASAPSESESESIEETNVAVVEETKGKSSDTASDLSSSPKTEEPVQEAKKITVEVSGTPQRGRRTAAVKADTPKPSLKRAPAPVSSESESVEEKMAPVIEETTENSSDVAADTPTSPTTEEPIKATADPVVEVSSTPQRSVITAVASPKIVSPKLLPSTEEQSLSDSGSDTIENDSVKTNEENVPAVAADSTSSPNVEDVTEPAEEPEAASEVSSTSRRGRRAVPPPKVATPKASAKRKAPDTESVSSENEVADKEVGTQQVPEVAEEVESDSEASTVILAPATPKRGRGRAPAKPKKETPKPRSKRTKRQSDSDSVSATGESTEKKDDESVKTVDGDEAVDTPATPRRTRRGAAASVPAKKTKRQSDSEGSNHPDEIEPPPAKEIRSSRSKKKKEDDIGSCVPVVRLTRCEVATTKSPVPVSPKGSQKKKATPATKEATPEEKAAPVRRGRGRAAAKPTAESDEASSVEDKPEEAPVGRRTAARQPKSASAVVDSSDDTDTGDVKSKKPPTRRVAAKRGGAASSAEKLDTVPEEKRRRGATTAKATALDDVEMMHEGKGHAADIHANHVPDDVEEEREKNDKSPVPTSGRSTRSKKALKVHFDVADPEVAASPAKSTRSTRRAAVTSSSPTERQVSVRLERDPEIEHLAAASANQDHAEDGAKRPRAKRPATTTATESPAKPTKRTRGKKAAPESDGEETSAAPAPAAPAAPSPRRTRRTRI